MLENPQEYLALTIFLLIFLNKWIFSTFSLQSVLDK